VRKIYKKNYSKEHKHQKNPRKQNILWKHTHPNGSERKEKISQLLTRILYKTQQNTYFLRDMKQTK
jgi:hypothetical protein